VLDDKFSIFKVRVSASKMQNYQICQNQI